MGAPYTCAADHARSRFLRRAVPAVPLLVVFGCSNVPAALGIAEDARLNNGETSYLRLVARDEWDVTGGGAPSRRAKRWVARNACYHHAEVPPFRRAGTAACTWPGGHEARSWPLVLAALRESLAAEGAATRSS